MEYKTPKVLEKKPIVAGFNLKMVVIIVVCSLLFMFMVFTNFLISLIFPIVAGGYVYMEKKYPGPGELTKVITYQTAVKCIHIDQNIRHMIIKREQNIELQTLENTEELEKNDEKTKIKLGWKGLFTVIETKLGLMNTPVTKN